MNYNTETINNIAEQLAKLLSAAVREQGKGGQGTAKIPAKRAMVSSLRVQAA